MHQIIKKQRGFTLVEMMVSVVVFSVAVLAMLVVLGGGIKDINYAKSRITATYLAQEGVEYIRNLRDNYVLYNIETGQNWGSFVSPAIDECVTGPCGFHDSSNILLDPISNSPLFSCSNIDDCNLFLEDTKYNYLSGDPSGFNRYINIKPVSPDVIFVISTVTWQQGTNTQSISFSEHLFNWY